MPDLKGAKVLGAKVIGEKAVLANWRLGNGSTYSIALNLGRETVPLTGHPPGKVVFETQARARDAADRGELGAETFIAWLTGAFAAAAFKHYAPPVQASGKASGARPSHPPL